jgi:hypothetical protein
VTNDKGSEVPVIDPVPSVNSRAPRARLLALFGFLVLTCLPPPRALAQAQPAFAARVQPVTATYDDVLPDFASYISDADETESEQRVEECPEAECPENASKTEAGNAVPRIFNRHGRQSWDGAMAGENPHWGTPNLPVADPADYPRPRSLENNNPGSFWYTHRPNIFNVPVGDEWDFYNLINTDRPDFTDAVYSVGKGVTFSENGYTFHKIDDVHTHISTRQLPESLIRHGLTDEFELRIKWNGYLMTDIKDQATGAHDTNFGGQDLDLGFKWELLQQRSWRPMVTVVSGILVPTGTRGVSANQAEPHFNLLAGWGIRRWLYVKWQTGADFLNANNRSAVTTIPSAVPGFVTTRGTQNSWHESITILTQWTKRVGAFHEWFMISNKGMGDTRSQHFLDMGAYIYATPNVQFDIRIGTRVSDRVNETFEGAGFSTRW